MFECRHSLLPIDCKPELGDPQIQLQYLIKKVLPAMHPPEPKQYAASGSLDLQSLFVSLKNQAHLAMGQKGCYPILNWGDGR